MLPLCGKMMFYKRCLGLVVLITIHSTTPASAQPAESAGIGSRVRLEAATVSSKPLIGTIVRQDPTSVVIWHGPSAGPSPGQLVVPRDAITKMEVSSGRQSHAKTGALIGAFAGAIAGGIVTPECQGSGFCVEIPKAAGAAAPRYKAGVVSLRFAF